MTEAVCICVMLRDEEIPEDNEGHKRLCPTGPSKRAALQRVSVLMRSSMRAAELRDKAFHNTGTPTFSIMKGAPSHSAAHLLTALEELGWTLTPINEAA